MNEMIASLLLNEPMYQTSIMTGVYSVLKVVQLDRFGEV